MSRTINEIIAEENAAQARLNELYTVITDEVNADANLNGLTSTSKTSEFNLWKYIASGMGYIQEDIWREAKAEIDSKAADVIAGTDRWLRNELLKFQYGDALLFNTKAQYYYALIDPTKQIIKRCSVVTTGGLTKIKVAGEDGSGNPIALTAPQLAAFSSYVNSIQWSGTNIADPISVASDKINAPFTIYYDGTLILDDLKPIIEAAFNTYLKNIRFNGEYSVYKNQDELQRALEAVSPNYNDVVPGVIQIKPNGGSYATVSRVYYPLSGYIEKDSAITFDDMFTYIPQ
jgi:hypothetical protein